MLVGVLTVVDLLFGRCRDSSLLRFSPSRVRLVGLAARVSDEAARDVYSMRGLLDGIQAATGATLHLHVARTNPRLARAYQRLGFESIGGDEVHIEMRRP